MKWFHENLSPGKPVSDSPLGLVPAEKKAVGAVMRKRKHMDEPSSPSRPGLDRAKIGTSSQGSSKKKPPMETRRNRERKTQQGLQETLASDITGVQKQDSEWGHSLPGPVVLPLQHNSPPPKERAASGFVGFLSSLFPFRYFFRKSSHSWAFQMQRWKEDHLLQWLLPNHSSSNSFLFLWHFSHGEWGPHAESSVVLSCPLPLYIYFFPI